VKSVMGIFRRIIPSMFHRRLGLLAMVVLCVVVVLLWQLVRLMLEAQNPFTLPAI